MCAAPSQEKPVAVNVETVIQGTVTRAGQPAGGAYVRLLDATGEFAAEVVASEQGAFRFFAFPGKWTVRALLPGGRAEQPVEAVGGEVTQVELSV